MPAAKISSFSAPLLCGLTQWSDPVVHVVGYIFKKYSNLEYVHMRKTFKLKIVSVLKKAEFKMFKFEKAKKKNRKRKRKQKTKIKVGQPNSHPRVHRIPSADQIGV
jgi:hypothetical protein